MSFQIIASPSARARLAASRAFIDKFPPTTELIVIAATRGAADDFVREVSSSRATFGLHRFSLVELAARAAAVDAAAMGRVAGTQTNAEALAARVTFDAIAAEELGYFGPVAETPGFPKALARTIHELRLASLPSTELDARTALLGAPWRDLARLLSRIDQQLDAAAVSDRAVLFSMASAAWRDGLRWVGYPVLFLDAPLNSVVERNFARVVIDHAADALLTCPEGDEATLQAFASAGPVVEAIDDDARVGSDLGRLRRHLFRMDPPSQATRVGDVRLFSAPGEARETLEIVRRVLEEAENGVAFDQMAVVLRTPQRYFGLLEHAFERVGAPAYFDRGTRRPDPAGRAFAALLSCAAEGLSAKRFDEYLSLGQTPRVDERKAPVTPPAPDDDAYARLRDLDAADAAQGDAAGDDTADALDSDDEAVVAGTLRAPWKWEELIVESAVIGGVDRADGKRRWRRRLEGLAADYMIQLDEVRREEPESPRAARIERDLRNLQHLREFALPIIDALADWPNHTSWGEWLDRFAGLAPLALKRPDRVLSVIAELRPMAVVAPVRLEEARDVLQERLLTLEWSAPSNRYGRVFVGSPHQIRGRAFRVVFVPGLAERAFPQRVREDPLLPDEARRSASDALVTRSDRTTAERLLLRLAIGAATDRLYLSYPRLGSELGDLRPRVPSFYALDVMRAITGRVPDHRALAAEAAEEADASLAWPAPRDPARAVDDFEHDLAVLKPLLDSRNGSEVKGRARYLLELNDELRRSVGSRWARGEKRWSTSDGLIRAAPTTAATLERNRLGRRPYSLSALQRFAVCPYQFLLAAIHRIQSWEEPQPIVRLDPLTRGSLFHRIQAELFRELDAARALPVTDTNLPSVIQLLHQVVDRVASEYAERLVPAIDRVWRDEIDEIRRDLGVWIHRVAADTEWVPRYFEFSFGLDDDGRDPRSLPEPIELDSRFILRGSVDLIEERRDGSELRVTDHKTGRNRTSDELVIGGGATLQPVLYSLAIEKGLERPVTVGRLYFCTTAGGFSERPIRINGSSRAQGLEALTIIDRAIELGRLPAYPQKDACRWCDFRPVCGPDEERRVERKPESLVTDLQALRSMK
jgi:CRISPR/Cas system-associated exonuclease Cas4 (RecB family)